MITSYIICGLPGAGKGTLAHALAKKTGGLQHQTREMFHPIFRSFSIEETRENFSKMTEVLQKTFGRDIFARAIDEFLRTTTHRPLIFDGVRRMSVIEQIRSHGEVYIIYVETQDELRYERMRLRGEKEDESSLSREQFSENDHLPSERELQTIREHADIILENNDSEENFFAQIDSLIFTHG